MLGVEIVQLCELDGPPVGYFCEGHHDPQQFAIAVNQEFELANQGEYVSTSSVKRGFLRKIPADGGGYFIVEAKPGKGAFNATYVWL